VLQQVPGSGLTAKLIWGPVVDLRWSHGKGLFALPLKWAGGLARGAAGLELLPPLLLLACVRQLWGGWRLFWGLAQVFLLLVFGGREPLAQCEVLPALALVLLEIRLEPPVAWAEEPGPLRAHAALAPKQVLQRAFERLICQAHLVAFVPVSWLDGMDCQFPSSFS